MFALTMLNPCKLAVVFDLCELHCPNVNAAAGIASDSHPTTRTVIRFILTTWIRRRTLLSHRLRSSNPIVEDAPLEDTHANPSAQRSIILSLLLVLAAGSWVMLVWQSALSDADMTMTSASMG